MSSLSAKNMHFLIAFFLHFIIVTDTAAIPKHRICLFVSPMMNFDFIAVKSFGIETYATPSRPNRPYSPVAASMGA